MAMDTVKRRGLSFVRDEALGLLIQSPARFSRAAKASYFCSLAGLLALGLNSAQVHATRQRPSSTIFLLCAACRTPADVALERIFDQLVTAQESPGFGGFEAHHRPAIGTAGGH
jgi:hypothetical protein